VEVDEAFIGGKESNKYMHQRFGGDAAAAPETVIVGMREKGGRTKAFKSVSSGKQDVLDLKLTPSFPFLVIFPIQTVCDIALTYRHTL
jgi:hypothetical protein